MIEQQGRILELQQKHAKVILGAASGCPACEAGQGCGAGIFGKLIKRTDLVLVLNNQLQLEPGQAVIVGIPETFFLRLVARLYLLPLLAALFGAGLGHYLGYSMSISSSNQDLLALAGSLFLAGLALFFNWKSKSLQVSEEQVKLLRSPVVQSGQQCRRA